MSNFTCSLDKGIKPTFVDYYVRNTVHNNDHEPSVFAQRRANSAIIDTFITKVSLRFQRRVSRT